MPSVTPRAGSRDDCRVSEPTFALGEFLHMTVERREAGCATAELVATESHQNPHGFVHGAVLFAMVDTSMGAATMSVLGEGQRCSTIELQLRFLRPVVSGRLSAETRVVKPGQRVVHLESKVHDADGRLVAMATGSFAVVRA